MEYGVMQEATSINQPVLGKMRLDSEMVVGMEIGILSVTRVVKVQGSFQISRAKRHM